MNQAASTPPVRNRDYRGFSDLFNNVITSGTYDSLPVYDRGRLVFLNMVQVVGSVTYLLFSVISFRSANLPLAISSLVGLVLLVGVFVYLRLTRNSRVGAWLDAGIISFLFGWLVVSGGEGGSGVLWTLSFPLITLFLHGARIGSLWALAMWAFIAVVALVPGFNPAGYTVLYAVRILGAYFFIWLFALAYESVRASTQRQLEQSNRQLEATTGELSAEKAQTDAILRSVKEGIFLVDAEGRLGSACSAWTGRILETEQPAGQELRSLLLPHLSEPAARAVDDWLPMLFAPGVNPQLVQEINPLSQETLVFFDADGTRREKIVRAGFEPLGNGTALCTMLDVSDEVRLQSRLRSEEDIHRRSMEKLFQIIHVEAGLMGEFIAEAEVELETINNYLRDPSVSGEFIIPLMFQGVHGIKGNALLLGLKELGLVIHGVEEEIRGFLDAPGTWKDLLKLTLGIGRIQQEIGELKEFIRKIMDYRGTDPSQGKGLLERSLVRLAKRDAEAQGKQVELDLSRFDAEDIPPRLRKAVKDCAVQLVRNSVHHGVEATELRQAAGKAAVARLELSLGVSGERLVLAVRDDGRGVDLAAIRQRVREAGEDPAAMSPEDLVKTIFRTGFSTARDTTLSAGRGAGLALVKQLAEAAGGGVGLRFQPGQGSEFQARFALRPDELPGRTAPGIASRQPGIVDTKA